MDLTWKGRSVAVIDGPLTEVELDRYRAAGRIVRRRFGSVRKYLP